MTPELPGRAAGALGRKLTLWMQLHPDHVEVFTESPADPDEPASNRRKTFLENSRKLDQSSTGLKERRAEEQVFEKEDRDPD